MDYTVEVNGTEMTLTEYNKRAASVRYVLAVDETGFYAIDTENGKDEPVRDAAGYVMYRTGTHSEAFQWVEGMNRWEENHAR